MPRGRKAFQDADHAGYFGRAGAANRWPGKAEAAPPGEQPEAEGGSNRAGPALYERARIERINWWLITLDIRQLQTGHIGTEVVQGHRSWRPLHQHAPGEWICRCAHTWPALKPFDNQTRHTRIAI